MGALHRIFPQGVDTSLACEMMLFGEDVYSQVINTALDYLFQDFGVRWWTVSDLAGVLANAIFGVNHCEMRNVDVVSHN